MSAESKRDNAECCGEWNTNKSKPKKQDGFSTSTTQPLQPGSWESSQTDSLASKPSSSATSPERPVLNHKQVQVEPQVFKNIQIFKENKIDDDRVTVGIFYV
jgi:hypothetical protein